MSSELEKFLMDEMDEWILKNNRKVTLTFLSNQWFLSSKDGEEILEKWLENYSGDRSIAKEYLIRGDDANGNSIITVISEKNLPKMEKVCVKFTKTLYSIGIESSNGQSLVQKDQPTENTFISLKLKSDPRNVKVHEIVIPQLEIKEAEPQKKINPYRIPTKPLPIKEKVKVSKKKRLSKASKKKQNLGKSIATFFAAKKPSTTVTSGSLEKLKQYEYKPPQTMSEAKMKQALKETTKKDDSFCGRREIIQNLISTVNHSITDSQFDEIAKQTEGFSDADIKVLCQEVAMQPLCPLSFSEILNMRVSEIPPVTFEHFIKEMQKKHCEYSLSFF